MYINNVKKIILSVKNVGYRETIYKFFKYVKKTQGNEVYSLIGLKPVREQWESLNKLEHKFDISIIIPTYNRLPMLEGLIESWREVDKVTEYTYEIIFSDDGSTDGSVEYLQKVTGLPIKLLANEHGGASKARNAAINVAKGKKLLIIGDDIFPNKNLVNQHYEKLKSLEETDAVLGECKWHSDLEVNHLMDHITTIGCEQFSFSDLPKNGFTDFRHFYTCNISIDREFLLSEKIIFDELFYKYGFEDVELGYRLAKKGMKIYYYPEAVGEHYHSYYDVEKFMTRQKLAGEMALVFVDLHPEIDIILNVKNISNSWSRAKLEYAKVVSCREDICHELVCFCQYVEDKYTTRNSMFSDCLSIIYKQLFLFSYEKGIAQRKGNLDINFLNIMFISNFYTKALNQAIFNINAILEVPNFTKILNFTEGACPPSVLEVKVSSIDEKAKAEECYKDILDYVLISTELTNSTNLNEYTYRPLNGFLLNVANIKQLILFLQNNDVDYIFLSFGLVDLPNVGYTGDVHNHVVFKNNGINIDDINNKDLRGKVVRLFSENYTQKINIKTLIKSKIKGDKFIIEGCVPDSKIKPGKKTIFIFPTLLAVGGVEKNTAEIIDSLKESYNFVIVNFESPNESLRSLHKVFIKNSTAVYDLGELGASDSILKYLEILKSQYNPSLIWICNGSPWLENNLSAVRRLFIDVAVVDQQVYDTKEGWVRLYKEKNAALLSFDKHIAINSKIQNIFINDASISSEDVELIYSVMSDGKREEALKQSKDDIYKKYNLDNNQKYIVFIGRITAQKDPLSFVELVRRIITKYDDSYKFIMVGDGELSSKVDALIQKYNLESNIIRIEYTENTYELDIIAEAIIFTSLYEGLSIALLEALSVGTPGISTDVGDTKLIFDKYRNGVLFNEIGNVDDYFSIFCDFIENYTYYKGNAIKNKSKIKEAFSKKTISKQYLSLFDETIKLKESNK